MSEPEVKADQVSVVARIEAYEAAKQAFDIHRCVPRGDNETRDPIETSRLYEAYRKSDLALYDCIAFSCKVEAVSHRGKIYRAEDEHGYVTVIEPCPEATEIDARNE